ncbi:hypothetical protein GCM10010207_48600 [Streptomyces atratus]|nr:hypothetical protein GCM10010207_48600 [Streptomyces atratus]
MAWAFPAGTSLGRVLSGSRRDMRRKSPLRAEPPAVHPWLSLPTDWSIQLPPEFRMQVSSDTSEVSVLHRATPVIRECGGCIR